MQLNPYLSFNGQCEAAFKFYEQCLGGKITAMMTYGESPMAEEVPPEWHHQILHTSLAAGNWELMGSDSPPEQHEDTKGFSISLNTDNPAEAEQLFHTLSKNGTVQMPLQKTFWATKFGMLTDQFGISWMVNCE
jgi:PhnB protein